MSTLLRSDIVGLSVPERILLVGDIWNSIAEVSKEVPLTDEQKRELDARLETCHQDPDAGSPWTVVRDRLRSRA